MYGARGQVDRNCIDEEAKAIWHHNQRICFCVGSRQQQSIPEEEQEFPGKFLIFIHVEFGFGRFLCVRASREEHMYDFHFRCVINVCLSFREFVS